MSDVTDVSRELRSVRTLLLNPTVDAVWECERKLTAIVVSIQKWETQRIRCPELQTWAGEIRLLLDSAMRFWQTRPLTSVLPQHYAPDGLLRQVPINAALVLEL